MRTLIAIPSGSVNGVRVSADAVKCVRSAPSRAVPCMRGGACTFAVGYRQVEEEINSCLRWIEENPDSHEVAYEVKRKEVRSAQAPMSTPWF